MKPRRPRRTPRGEAGEDRHIPGLPRPPLPKFEVMFPAWFTTYENMRRDLHAVFERQGVRVLCTYVKTGAVDDVAGFLLRLEGREPYVMAALRQFNLGSLEVNGQLVEV